MTERNIAYDYLRSLAILLVAVLHAWSLLKMDEPQYGMMCYLYRAIVDAGVPLFVLISGALVLSSPISSLSSFFQKRLKRVLIPFVIWATIIYIIGVYRHQYDNIQNLSDALLCWFPYLLNNQINVSHWFVHMIIALYLLTPVLQRVIQNADGKQLCEYILILILVCLLLKWFFPSVFILTYSSTLFGYIGLYLAGYYIAQYGTHFAAADWIYGITAMALYVINVLTDCPNNVLTQLTAVAVFGTILSIHRRHPLSSSCLVVAISRYSYCIYLVHIPIICAIYLLVHAENLQWWLPLVVGIGVVAICTFGCWIVDRIPGKWKNYLGIAG